MVIFRNHKLIYFPWSLNHFIDSCSWTTDRTKTCRRWKQPLRRSSLSIGSSLITSLWMMSCRTRAPSCWRQWTKHRLSLSGSPPAGSDPTPSCEMDRKGALYNVKTISMVCPCISCTVIYFTSKYKIIPENVSQCQNFRDTHKYFLYYQKKNYQKFVSTLIFMASGFTWRMCFLFSISPCLFQCWWLVIL